MAIPVATIEPALPCVTVVIPARDEQIFIGRNLDAVLAQDYPADRLEVLVADGGSADATRDIVHRVAERVAREGGGARVRLIDNPGRIMSTGANAAIRSAAGEVIVLLGGHAWLPAHYVRTCVTALLANDVDVAGGTLETVGDGPMGEAIAAALASPFGIGNSGFRTLRSGEPIEVDTVAYGAYRRDVFERVGLFDESMVRHQHYELNHRLRSAGGTILLIPDLRAVYHARSSLTELWRQYWLSGVWKGRLLGRRPASVRMRHLAPSLFAVGLLGSAIGMIVWPPFIVLFGLLFGAYLGFIVVALASFVWRGKWRLLPLLPLVLACLHFGYGLGVWAGLARPVAPSVPRLPATPRA